jgi:hypothetical protein
VATITATAGRQKLVRHCRVIPISLIAQVLVIVAHLHLPIAPILLERNCRKLISFCCASSVATCKSANPDIQKWITFDPEAEYVGQFRVAFSAISLGTHGVSMAILQRCRTLNGKWSSFKRLSKLIGDTTAQSGCR